MKKMNMTVLMSLLLLSLMCPVHPVFADGTETLGPPGIPISSGTGILTAGTGMVGDGEGTIQITVPAVATVRQVLLYWEGQMRCETDDLCPGDDSLVVNGQPVQGALIGGPTDLASTSAKDYDVVSSTYRADITGFNLVVSGANTLNISEMEFTYANNGAGVLVIYDNGVIESDIGIVDGNDFAYWKRSSPLNETKAQTFVFTPAETDRVAHLNMFFSSVSGSISGGEFRPSAIDVTLGGSTVEYNNLLNSVDGDEWDTLALFGIQVPAGVSDMTVQAFSEDRLLTGNNPASFNWIAAGLSIERPARFGGCTPGYWKQSQHRESWAGYAPEERFGDVFGCTLTIQWSEKGKPGDVENPTLLQALQANGGGQSALARHAVAALLNAANPDVHYPRTIDQIKQMVCAAIDSEHIDVVKDQLVEWNERGCTADEPGDVIEPGKKDKSLLEGSETLGALNKESSSGGCFISSLEQP